MWNYKEAGKEVFRAIQVYVGWWGSSFVKTKWVRAHSAVSGRGDQHPRQPKRMVRESLRKRSSATWCALEHNSTDVAELGRRDFLPRNGIFFSLIGNEKRHFSLLFADGFDPNPNILFSY
jgi:hypothetical protein